MGGKNNTTMAESGIIKRGKNYSKLGGGIKKWHKNRKHKNLFKSQGCHYKCGIKKQCPTPHRKICYKKL